MSFLIYILNGLIIFGFPLLMYSDTNSTDIGCFQPMAFMGTFVTLFALDLPFVLTRSLQNPFDEKADIKVDSLVASVELGIFQTMRAVFFETRKERPGTLAGSKRMVLIQKSNSIKIDSMLSKRKGGYGEL